MFKSMACLNKAHIYMFNSMACLNIPHIYMFKSMACLNIDHIYMFKSMAYLNIGHIYMFKNMACLDIWLTLCTWYKMYNIFRHDIQYMVQKGQQACWSSMKKNFESFSRQIINIW